MKNRSRRAEQRDWKRIITVAEARYEENARRMTEGFAAVEREWERRNKALQAQIDGLYQEVAVRNEDIRALKTRCRDAGLAFTAPSESPAP